MRVLFIWYQRTIFISGDSKHNSNSNEQRHRHRHRQASTKKQHVRIDSYFTSSAAQHCIAYYTKQTKQTHKPRDYYLLIISIGRGDRYVHTVLFLVILRPFTPPTPSNSSPFFVPFPFLFFLFVRFPHTQIIIIDRYHIEYRQKPQQPHPVRTYIPFRSLLFYDIYPAHTL